jgi:hypothetical protein
MSQAIPPISPEVFEAYLDGRLAGDELVAAEAAVRADPELARESDLHRRMTGSLKSQFAPPAIELPAPPPLAFKAPPAPVRRWAVMALAAALVLCVTGGMWFALASRISGSERLYRTLAAANYRPDWVCSTDEQFVEILRYRLGDAFLVNADAAVALIGWKYVREPLSIQALALMAKVDGDHSVVLVDRLINDKPLEEPSPGSGLKLFRREIGGLVLYEITPLSTPRLLDLAYPAPPAPPGEEAPPGGPPPG